MSLRLDLGEDSYRRQSLNEALKYGRNGMGREVQKGRRNASVDGLRRRNNKYACVFFLESGDCSLIAGFPCHLLPLFEPPKKMKLNWGLSDPSTSGARTPLTEVLCRTSFSDCFPSLLLPWPRGLQAFPGTPAVPGALHLPGPFFPR